MNYRSTLLAVTAGAALTLGATEVLSQDTDADIAEAMAQIAQWMNPTDVHQALGPMVGDFDVTWKFRPIPAAPWKTGDSEAKREWVLGGRFIEETSTGEGEPMTTEGTYSDPMSENKHRWYRTVWRIVDKDTNVHEMYSQAEDGSQFLALEITYKRK